MKLRLEINVSPESSFAFEHGGPSIRIGRDPEGELALTGDALQSVSWNHARIELTSRSAYLIDLQSTNGTFVGGKRVDKRAVLKVGDQIRLGEQGPKLRVVELSLAPGSGERGGRPREPSGNGPAQLAGPAADALRSPVAAVAVSPTRRLLLALERQQRIVTLAAGAVAVLLVIVGLALWLSRVRPRAGTAESGVAAAGAAGVDSSTRGTSSPPAAANGAAGTDSSSLLARQAGEYLTKYCYRCHGLNGAKEGGFDFALDREKLIAKKKLVAGKPEDSRLFKRVASNEMPPEEESPRPSTAETEVLRQWIAAGAPAITSTAAVATRSFKSEFDVLAAIRDDLQRTQPSDRRFRRYYSLSALANNSSVNPSEMPLYRAALSKLVNSLSWKPSIIRPQAIGRDETLFAVDLRDVGWDERDLWREVLRVYPYGRRFDSDRDKSLRDLAAEVQRLTGTELPYVRADWFVARASRPPLYHTLLNIPRNALDLERELGVNIVQNFERDRLQRAGFTASGVSKQNRLLERHDARHGAYWKSYDFKANDGRGNLVKFPLGPLFQGNPFASFGFVHDGGEIIFNLPNGLQAYMLVDGRDNRIDEGPVEVVSDGKKTSGTPVIVNGLSCMACHRHGMIRDGVKDIIRDGHAVSGEAVAKVDRLFPPATDMDELLRKDEERFLKALAEATSAFLPGRDVREGEEPIALLARRYISKDLNATDVAAELGMPDAQALLTQIKNSATLRERLGLGPLLTGSAIKREAWESLPSDGFSHFQEAARELGLGTPTRVR